MKYNSITSKDGRYTGIVANTACLINYIFCGLEVARKP